MYVSVYLFTLIYLFTNEVIHMHLLIFFIYLFAQFTSIYKNLYRLSLLISRKCLISIPPGHRYKISYVTYLILR